MFVASRLVSYDDECFQQCVFVAMYMAARDTI